MVFLVVPPCFMLFHVRPFNTPQGSWPTEFWVLEAVLRHDSMSFVRSSACSAIWTPRVKGFDGCFYCFCIVAACICNKFPKFPPCKRFSTDKMIPHDHCSANIHGRSFFLFTPLIKSVWYIWWTTLATPNVPAALKLFALWSYTYIYELYMIIYVYIIYCLYIIDTRFPATMWVSTQLVPMVEIQHWKR